MSWTKVYCNLILRKIFCNLLLFIIHQNMNQFLGNVSISVLFCMQFPDSIHNKCKFSKQDEEKVFERSQTSLHINKANIKMNAKYFFDKTLDKLAFGWQNSLWTLRHPSIEYPFCWKPWDSFLYFVIFDFLKTFRQPSILYYFIFWKPWDSPVFCIFFFVLLQTLRQPCRAELPLFTPCRIARLFFFNWNVWSHWSNFKKNWSLECILVRINIWAGSYLYASDVEPVREVNVPVSSSRGGRIPDTWIQNSEYLTREFQNTEYLIREYRIQKTWYVQSPQNTNTKPIDSVASQE